MKKLPYLFPLLVLPFLIILTGCQFKKPALVTNFDECIKAGYLIIESYPLQCRTDAGQIFTEEITSETKKRTRPPVVGNTNSTDEFCGWSTKEPCDTSDDCVIDGCSNQVCLNQKNKGVITTCEARGCYEAEKYQMACQCVSRQCQWAKEE